MERAILKTLNYFGYPLKVWEIHKWLIGRKVSMSQVEKALNTKSLKKKVRCIGDYYFLKNKRIDFDRRVKDEQLRLHLLKKAKIVAPFLRFKKGVNLLLLDQSGVIDVTDDMSLRVEPKNIDNALRVLKLQVLWDKDHTFGKVLEENSWIYKYFPNVSISTS